MKLFHNHPTRDIKEYGQCPGCDRYWNRRFAEMIDEISEIACEYGYRIFANTNDRRVVVLPKYPGE